MDSASVDFSKSMSEEWEEDFVSERLTRNSKTYSSEVAQKRKEKSRRKNKLSSLSRKKNRR
jgi:hypothetical protein